MLLEGLRVETGLLPEQLPGAAVDDSDLATPERPGETRDPQQLIREYGWRRCSEGTAALAHRLFQMAWVCHPGLRPIRVACMRGSNFVVKDIQHVACAGPNPHRAFGSSAAAPYVVAMRAKQIAANRPHYKCDVQPGCESGNTAYVIGNGPSARYAAAFLPRRDRRKGKVLAINGASKWFNGDMDYWATWDWLGRPHWVDGIDFTGCQGLFSQYAARGCVEEFERRGGNPNYFLGGNRNPYRQHAKYADLPSLEEGLETMFSALHFCYYAGFSNIVLFGAEHAIRPESLDLHGGEGDAPRVAAAQELAGGVKRLFDHKGNWIYTEVLDYRGRPCWTTPHLHNGAAFIVGMLMFLHESGVDCWNASGGLELVFAQHCSPQWVIGEIETATRETALGAA